MKQVTSLLSGRLTPKAAVSNDKLAQVAQTTLVIFVFSIPLVWWPLADHAFSVPKFVVMADTTRR